MTVGEQALVELRTRLEGVLGAEEAATLMDHLPRDPAATKGDVQALETTIGDLIETMSRRFDEVDLRFQAVDRRFDEVDLRFQAVDRRFEAVDRRFEAMDRRFDDIEQHRFPVLDIRLEELEKRLDERIDSRSQILEYRISGALSEVREDFARQMSIQTRITLFSTISALITLATLTQALSGT